MTRRVVSLAAIILFALGCLPQAVKAQTTYNLPNSSCSVQASNFLYCSNMGTVNINGTGYVFYLSAVDILNLYQNPEDSTVNTSFGSANFQNANTLVDYPGGFTSGTYVNRHLTLTFGGTFPGQVDLDLVRSVQQPPCYRGCRVFWTAENVVVTLQ